MTCLSEVHVSMFVDLHASAIKLTAETRKNMLLRRLVVGLSSRTTRFYPKPVHVGICIGQTGTGAVDSIHSSPYEVCVEKTGTRTSDSVPDQSMWDCVRQTGTGAADNIFGQSTSDVRRTVALRKFRLRVIRFPLANIIPPTLPLIHPPTRTSHVHNFSN